MKVLRRFAVGIVVILLCGQNVAAQAEKLVIWSHWKGDQIKMAFMNAVIIVGNETVQAFIEDMNSRMHAK